MKDDDDNAPEGFDDFVDRDDDGDGALIDRDRGIDEAPRDAAAASDPGFAAFRDGESDDDSGDDFADPLDDWPDDGDDRPLEALAEELAISVDDTPAQRSAPPAADAWADAAGPDSGAAPDTGDAGVTLPAGAEPAFPDDDIDDGATLRDSVDTDDALPAYPEAPPPDAGRAIDRALGDAQAPAGSGEVSAGAAVDDDMIESLIDEAQAEDSADDHGLRAAAVDAGPGGAATADAGEAAQDWTGTGEFGFEAEQDEEAAVIDALAEEAFGSAGTARAATAGATGDAAAPAPEPPAPAAVEPAGDDLVDDFLTELDDHDDDFEAHPACGASAAAAAATAASSAPETAGARALDGRRGDTGRTGPVPGGDAAAPRPAPPGNGPADDSGGRRPPWGMIASLAVALLLLAVGGYGVLEQRSALQEEIRDLQARLSTAVSAEEAGDYRERQAQLELRNANLGAELQRLQAQRDQLAERVDSLQQALDSSRENAAALRAQADRAQDDAAARAAAAREAAASAARAEQATAPAGAWFVNFGSYAARDVAADWSQRIDVDDGRVVIREASRDGRTLYRLRVIGLADRDAAERVARQLERRFDLPRLWVGRN